LNKAVLSKPLYMEKVVILKTILEEKWSTLNRKIPLYIIYILML